MRLRHVGSCSPPPGKSWGVLPARHGRRSTRWQETRRPAWAPPPASVGLSRPQNQSDHEVHGSPSPLLAPTVEHNGTRFSWSVGSAQPRYSPKELNCTQSLLSSGLVSVSILNPRHSLSCSPCSLFTPIGRGQKIDEKCPSPALPLESVLSSGPSSDCQSLLLTIVFFEGKNKINSSGSGEAGGGGGGTNDSGGGGGWCAPHPGD